MDLPDAIDLLAWWRLCVSVALSGVAASVMYLVLPGFGLVPFISTLCVGGGIGIAWEGNAIDKAFSSGKPSQAPEMSRFGATLGLAFLGMILGAVCGGIGGSQIAGALGILMAVVVTDAVYRWVITRPFRRNALIWSSCCLLCGYALLCIFANLTQ